MRSGLAALACCSAALAADVAVESPDGKIRFLLSTGAKSLQYTITLTGKPVVETSPIGITVDGVRLAEGAEVGRVERYQTNENYPWNGNHSTAIDRSNGAKIAVTHAASHRTYELEIRVADDGAAFRHVVPGTGSRTPDEATAFRVPAGSTVWYHDLNDHYEGAHTRKALIGVAPGQWVATPFTYRLPGTTGYASITEAALAGYSGMGLQADGEGGFDARLGHAIPASYPFRLRYKDDVTRLTRPASITGPIRTPWRVVLVSADLNTLVNSDLIHNLAPPPDSKLFPEGIRTVWAQPGRAVWSYLDGGNQTLEGMKEFSRLAGELGFEYNILEGFWSRWPEAQLKELADYSRQRGVKILIWTSRKNIQDPAKMRDFFAMCQRNGVAGAKIDFFDHEHKEIIDLYEAILRTAAEFHQIVDFHGANKPTGLERTWPNMLGFEGIRGMETQPPWSRHEATVPFTRMLAGLTDYTPMHFGKKLGDTTWPHQIANAILLQAPLLCYAAHPASILANPAVDVIRAIPSTWDETVVLPISDIGEVAAFARRKGDTWFVAVSNGPNARTVKLDLSFLASGTERRADSYRATLVRDTGEAAAVKMESLIVSRTDSIFVDLRSGGGFVARLVR
jgi:alpha-glucosidase